MAEHRSSITIDAPPESVFPFLVTGSGITAWMGQWAELDPVPGGSFAVDISGYCVRGSVIEIDPPRRLVVSWGFVGLDALPPGTSTVVFELIAVGSQTLLEVHHTDLPDSEVAGHAVGWAHFLARLSRAGRGEQLPPDTWDPTADPAATSEKELS